MSRRPSSRASTTEQAAWQWESEGESERESAQGLRIQGSAE